MRRAGLILVMLAAAGSAAAQPVGRWVSGFGQGVNEAAVRDIRSQELRFACPTRGQTRFPPSVTLTLEGRGAAVEARPVTFQVDGRGLDWAMDRQPAAEEGRVVYRFEARTDEGVQAMGRLAAALQSGRRLVVLTPDDGRRHGFSLRGSSTALAGCPRE